MAGLAILKHMHSLSDEALCARWLENLYFQCFCGEHHFRHALPFDRSSLTRWRQRMGEQRLSVQPRPPAAALPARPAGAVIRDIERKIQGDAMLAARFRLLLMRAHRVLTQNQWQRAGKRTPCRGNHKPPKTGIPNHKKIRKKTRLPAKTITSPTQIGPPF